MSFLPLALGVGFSNGAGSGGFSPPSKSRTEQILKRDDYTCRFCGFRSTQYQRIVPYEGEPVTACTFCEQVMSMERAGMMGSGVLIWLPELTQAELNHVARAVYVARADEAGPLAAAAERAYEALIARKTEAKKRLGSEDPLLLSAVLHENMNDADRKTAIAKLEGVRLLPLDKHMVRVRGHDINGFPQMIKFWRSEEGPFGDLPTEKWKDLFAKVSG